jgi:hypothetical protein
MRKKSADITIICELADAPKMIPGSTFDQVCVGCERRVMLSPFGQDLLKRHPTARIICARCFEPREGDVLNLPSREQLADAHTRSQPNPWRNRN